MADKQATVRINADPRGFVKGLKDVEKAGEATGAKIETSLKKAAKKAAKSFTEAAKELEKTGKVSADSLSGLQDQAKTVAKAYKDAYKEAVKLEQLRSKRQAEQAAASAASRKESIGTLKTIGGAAVGGALAIGGKAVADANAIYDKAARLSIASRGAGKEAVDPTAFMSEWFAITQQIKGVTADQLADGAARFVSMTGDLETARSSLSTFAEVAVASGAQVEDVAATAAAISQQFGITDPNQIKEVLASLVFQGKAGAFELKDAASLFPGLAAAGAAFGLDKGVGGVKTLGGIVQIARQGTGSGEVAATNVNALLNALKVNADKLEREGAKVYEGMGKSKKVRDLPTILAEVISNVGGTDIAKKNKKLTELLTDTGAKAISPLIGQYQDMLATAKGASDTERQAEAQRMLREKILESINAAGDYAEVQRDVAIATSTASAKMTASWERVVAGVSTKVLPKLIGIADRFSKMDGVIDAFTSGLGLAASGLEQFNDFINLMTGKTMDTGVKSYYSNEAARERQRAESLTKELGKIAPGVGVVDVLGAQKAAGGDEAKFRQIRDLQTRIITAEAQASAFEEKAKVGVTPEMRAAAHREVAGEELALRSGDKGGVAKVEMPDKEMRVRVTNPKDIGQPGNGAPAPGWTPPRG